MSDDLFLRPRCGAWSHDRFRESFGARHHDVLDRDMAAYQHSDTGVHFTFVDVGPGAHDDSDEPSELGEFPLEFNIHFFRPSCFAREAEPELTALMRSLDLVVHDPQIEGVGDSEYEPAGFLRGWDAGNRVTHAGTLARMPARPYALPGSELMCTWRWNLGRRSLQESLTEDGPVLRTGYSRAPRDVVDFVKSRPPAPSNRATLRTDQVLDAELVAHGS